MAATAFSVSAAPAASDEAQRSAETRRDDNGLFYIGGKVGSKTIRFLVDTGASHVILSHADARKIDSYTAVGDTRTVMTAGGPVAVDWIVIKDVAFGDHSIKNLKAAIPRRDVGLSLLGQNALAQFDAVHIDGDRLTLVR
ncbi:MAG TPA: TIGR02281 family clan AA aspartic protease [Sphingopyxis sp.]|uniref:retropepsin-like aspartic protease family protein n=1 Tax=Sphingopyxis sp. TaxID=1908224 RepID=UPI002E14714F|nr:TIGR02281 family clan AA aspartic protease [Sphingopyxis sp.]